MKIKMPLFIFLLMLISCNDNDGKDDKDVIQVEAKALRAWPGTTSTLSIISDGIFSVTSLDPAVAQAKVEDKTLIVTATGIGSTSLLLRGENYEDLQIKVSTMLMGLYTEEHEFEKYAPKISVRADEKTVAEGIIRELTSEMAKFNNCHYGFGADERLSLRLQGSNLNNPYWGTFSWDGKTLVLNYDNKSDTYFFKGVNNGPRPYMFSATLNLTDKYKEIYPNAGIENVSVERFISAIPPFGIE
ncbi:MAG: hypothetical protein RR996_00775 [Alistipes sp.]